MPSDADRGDVDDMIVFYRHVHKSFGLTLKLVLLRQELRKSIVAEPSIGSLIGSLEAEGQLE